MSWLEMRAAFRLAAVVALAAGLSGCFTPMYAERPDGAPGLRDKLSTVEVPPLRLPNASREARLGVAIRNALMFAMYGGPTGAAPAYRLDLNLRSTRSSVMVDPATARPDVENYGIDASYQLVDIATGKQVMNGSTFARVSFDNPGQEQRFARVRSLRDAEDRAARQIADSITTRLAAYFTAGT
ncbi:MAG: LPS assembly lipoprotein LptE [Xanthobacteraceae bacterium]